VPDLDDEREPRERDGERGPDAATDRFVEDKAGRERDYLQM
jgi:hypothetical protein